MRLRALSGVGRDIARTAGLFAAGAERRAVLWHVVRAYLTHLPSAIPRATNALLGVSPVRRTLALPERRDLWYRPGTSDLRVLKQVFIGDEYEPDGALTGPVEYIVDLGSNIGVTALLWSVRYPQARILCVEPDEENFGILQRNLEPLGGRAVAVRAAVSDHDGTVDFYRSTSIAFWSSSTDPAIATGNVRKVTVPALTVPSILGRSGFPRVDLMKMDIEGGERAALPGMATWPMVPAHLTAELHDPYGPADFARDVAAAGMVSLPPTARRRMAWGVRRP